MARPNFPSYPDRCGWNAMLPDRAPHPSLGKDVVVDHVVVGAGYTGLAVARRLSEIDPQARIVVLEATTVGEGSSGRNSGFTAADVLPRGVTMAMADKARRQSVLFGRAFDWLLETLDANGVDCDLRRSGAIRGAATTAGELSLKGVVEVAKSNGIPHEILSKTDIEERIGTDYYRYGVYLRDTILLQPAALIRGLADHLPPNVTLHENTPVSSMKRDGEDWIVETPRGIARCKKVALATNGFIPRFGYLKSRMTTIHTYAGVTERLSDNEVGYLGRSEAWGLLPSHRLGTTLRRIGRDRLMVRSLYAHERDLDGKSVRRHLRDRFERRYPNLRHVPFEYVWGGVTALTMNGSPWWGMVDKDVYASGGCNGSGIAKGTMLGRHLAELMTGTGDAETIRSVMGVANWIAPEPFRSIGFRIISAIESRKADLEA